MKTLFTLAFFFFTLQLQAQVIWEYRKDSTFTYKLTVDSAVSNHDSSDVYFFATEIKVFNAEEVLIQKIPLGSIDFTFSRYDSAYIFMMEDMNFDRYEDFGFQTWLSVRMDREYQFWFYDTIKGNFKKDTCLSKIMNPHVHPIREIVCSFHHDGGFNHGYSKYRWNANTLMLFDELIYTEGPVKKEQKGLFRPRGAKAYEIMGDITHRWLEDGVWKESWETVETGTGVCPCNCE